MSDLYRLIYTSRNLLPGSEDEQAAAVDGILAVSKRNNARVGVTGALLFNAGSFAQVLEGPRAAVESTFERIQRDPRHSDVSVLQCEPIAARGFPNWAMAFVGNSARGRSLWGEFAQRTGFDVAHADSDRLFATLLAIVEREEAEAAFALPPAAREAGLDVERLRGALREHLPPAAPAAPATAPAPAAKAPRAPSPAAASTAPATPADAQTSIEACVLRGALDEERGRTTALRRELDDARIALAAALAQTEAVERLRDLWAERARAMAAILAREPELGHPEASAQNESLNGAPGGAQAGVRPTLVKAAG